MPNGEGKNWIRLCAAIDGFRARYKAWPTEVRVFDGYIKEMRDVLGQMGYYDLEKKVRIVEDGLPIVALDDAGRRYSYGDDGVPKKDPDMTAKEWLEIRLHRLNIDNRK
ncbi:MAG: hypothetical protein VR64_07255 [Desulfatitalea sp. BRH_c12]|nr:MAG: hypothetical protein VR64_07255 [Desulfatitalea sp. BRH_c12]